MKNQRLRKIIATALLAAAVAMMVAGLVHQRRVYEDSGDFAEFGLRTFTRVRDVEMAIDATFSGIVRKDGRLYTTYDRMAPRGKQACPT